MTVLDNDNPTSPLQVPVINNRESLMIKVRRLDQSYVSFRIRKTRQLEKLMKAYCEECNIDESSVTFRYHGTTISPVDTASSLGMGEVEIIDVIHLDR